MGYSQAGHNAALDGVRAAGSWIQAHSSASDGSATAPTGSVGSRAQTTWNDTGGDSVSGSQVSIAITGGTTVRYWSLWTAATAGTCLGTWQLAADEVFGADGTLNHTPTISAAG